MSWYVSWPSRGKSVTDKVDEIWASVAERACTKKVQIDNTNPKSTGIQRCGVVICRATFMKTPFRSPRVNPNTRRR
jgi:hypothetical protein